MSDDKAKEAPAPSGPSKLPMILAFVNTLGVLVALGAVVYTQVLYKRPKITETSEREKFESAHTGGAGKDKLASGVNTALVAFDPITANIAPEKGTPGESSKIRYANINFSLEVRDAKKVGNVEAIKIQFLDALLSALGRKSFADLTTVQGRYVLRSEMISIANGILKEDLVTNVYFGHYVIQ